MPCMLVTLAMFQDERSPLKEEALLNMPCMMVTLTTFHEERSPLKEVAP